MFERNLELENERKEKERKERNIIAQEGVVLKNVVKNVAKLQH